MKNSLFDSFEEVSASEWKDKVIKDLKGKDFKETLLVKDEIEGIEYSPLFHQDDRIAVSNLQTHQENESQSFKNIVIMDCSQTNANENISEALMNGADGIWFKNLDFNSLAQATKGILFDCIKVVFEVSNSEEATQLTQLLIDFKDTADINIISPIQKEIYTEFDAFAKVKFIANGLVHHNNGCNVSQEIAVTLSQALEINYLLNNTHHNVGILLGSGSNYFYEIAKYRAIRSLWTSICEFSDFNQKTIEIHSCTGRINMALQDHHTNLLRQTTQAMSGCIGGANLISVEPYDYISTESSERIQRMAKNIPLILKEEGYLDKIIDPANGSYYIEWLTNQWKDKALDIFKTLENQGGYNASRENSFIDSITNETISVRRNLFEDKKIELIGVNLYNNDNIEPLQIKETTGFRYENNIES